MLTKSKAFVILGILIITGLLHWSSHLENDNVSDQNLLIMKRFVYKEYFIDDYIQEPKYSKNICAKNPYLLIIVTSYVGHVELRSAHRRAMPAETLKSFNTTRIFLLAKIPDKEKSIKQEAVIDENDIYGDLLQGPFEEHYRNLTHKHLMGLKWAAEKCPKAKYILKLDDDTVFGINKTYQYISHLKDIDRNDFLIGYVLEHTIPKRKEQNKWMVSLDEYPGNEYPPYLSGWYYITTPETAARLTNEAKYYPYFWIDDVFVTGILREALNIKLKHLPQGFVMGYYENVECCITNMIKKNIMCNSVVGPNGNRNDLINIFNSALNHCYFSRKCKSDTQNKTQCVVMKDRAIFSAGQPVIQPVKV